ncbi:uncharacterized protein IAS62_000325 [Cryptococcus decagattii]|uniref:Uncharacterized protein n=1 Tax=Cryptococcus decagattii TaxID=1859122 RepID=A0ABZ2AM81_9TREE
MTQCSKDEDLIQEIHIRIVEKQEGLQESSWDGCISVYSQLKRIFGVSNDDVHEDGDVDSYRFMVLSGRIWKAWNRGERRRSESYLSL